MNETINSYDVAKLTDRLSEDLASILNSQGFKSMDVMANRLCQSPEIEIKLMYKSRISEHSLRDSKQAREEVGNYLKEFNNMIIESSPIREVLEKVEAENKKLKEELNRLQKFEIHYKMQYVASHGKSWDLDESQDLDYSRKEL